MGFMVWGREFRVQSAGFRGFGSWVKGFRVKGFRVRVSG